MGRGGRVGFPQNGFDNDKEEEKTREEMYKVTKYDEADDCRRVIIDREKEWEKGALDN